MATITQTAIANMALAELGAQRIVSFTDGSKNQGLVVSVYDFAKEHALCAHPWNFAIKRKASQAALSTPPEWGWDFAFAVPSDCLRILILGKDGVETDEPWQHESAQDGSQIIVTNLEAPVDIKYIYNVTNTQTFSPMFVIAFVKTLKWLLARPLTGKAEIQVQCANELREFFSKGMSTDGQEGTPEPYGSSELEDVR